MRDINSVRAITDSPSASGFDFTGDSVKDLAVIISPANLDEPFNISNFPSDLSKPKWTAVESNALIFFHEAQHFDQNGTVLLNEMDSDLTAIKVYKEAMEDGHPLTEIGIEELKAQRLVSSFVSQGNDIDLYSSVFGQVVGEDMSVLGQRVDNTTHTTHLALEGTENLLEITSAMINVRTMNNMLLGMDQLMRSNEEYAIDGEYSVKSQNLLNANDPLGV